MSPSLPAASLRVSIVIPVRNASVELRRCLAAIRAGGLQPDEILVVDDASTDDTAAAAHEFGVRLLNTAARMGPSVARNMGAAHATGDILCFLDADVCVSPGAVGRMAEHFADPGVHAVIGSYDSEPDCLQLISQYRNLVHHYTHQTASPEATTFWSGCGAIRREVFVKMGGFDASYMRPAIEDIELGYRLHAAGYRIVLDPVLQVKHLKRWTFPGMVRTDVLDRGIPWTLLILRAGRMPNDLNIRWHQRLSVAAAAFLLISAACACVMHGGEFLTPAAAMLLLTLGSFWVCESVGPDGGSIQIAMVVSLASLLLLCSVNRHYDFFNAVWIGYAFLFFREKVSQRRGWLKRPLGFLYGGYLATSLLLMARALPPSPAILCLGALAALIVAVNYRFFAFLFGRIGNVAGLALVPVHMLHFACSGFSFLAGIAISLVKPKPQSSR